jgi:MFS family permease
VTIGPVGRIRAVFILHALASGGFYPRLPQLQAMIGVDEAGLGLVLLGFPVGAILTFLLGSRFIEHVGTRAIVRVCIPLLPVAAALLGAMPEARLLFAWFIVVGVLYALPNTAMNIEADRVEAATGRRVMNSCHGLWSAGYLAATLCGTLAEALGLSPLLHMALVALVVAPLGLWLTAGMAPAPARPFAATARRTLALPTAAILLLVLFTLGPALLEGALRNWSVIYMRDSFDAPSWVDTLTLPVFLAAHALMRLNADRFVTRFGLVPVARVLMLAAFAGCVLVVLAPDLWVALGGFLLIGVGVSTAFPMTASAAAQIGDRPAVLNISSLTLATQVLMLGAPAALGWVATRFGIASVFAVLLPTVLLSLWLARFLVPRPGRAAAESLS